MSNEHESGPLTSSADIVAQRQAAMELLSSSVCALPIHINEGRKGLDFLKLVQQKIERYHAKFDEVQGSASSDKVKTVLHSIFNCSQALGRAVIESIQCWLDRGPSAAHESLKNPLKLALGGLCIDDERQWFDGPIGRLVQTRLSTELTLYRARKQPVAGRLKREEFFHIPFDERWKVSTQRYSSPGMPCLYLAESCAGCWEELGRPDHDSLWFARFGLRPVGTQGKDRRARILDYGITPPAIVASLETRKSGSDLRGLINDDADEYAMAYLAAWPLIAACSVQILDSRSASVGRGSDSIPFRVEYILPQLVLGLLREFEIDGLRYFSTVPSDTDYRNVTAEATHELLRNYALPVQSSPPQGHCEKLAALVWAGEGLSWMQMVDFQGPLSGEVLMANTKARFPLGASYEYEHTLFFKMERFLQSEGGALTPFVVEQRLPLTTEGTSPSTITVLGPQPRVAMHGRRLDSQEYAWEHMGKLLSRGPDAWDVLQPQLSIYPAAVASLQFLFDENYIDEVEFETIPPNSVADVPIGRRLGIAKYGDPKSEDIFKRLLELHKGKSREWVRFKAVVTPRGRQALAQS